MIGGIPLAKLLPMTLEEMCEEVEKETAERVAKETARSLLALGKFSYEDISQGTGLPLEVVEELAAQKTA